MSTPPEDPHGATAQPRPAPGWYDDPGAPGRPRWWDGERWAPPGALPAGAPAGPPPAAYGRPAVDIDQEQRSAARARGGLIVGIVAGVVNALCTVFVFDWAVEYFREVFDAIERGATTAPEPPPMTTAETVANGLTNLTGIGMLVAGILFVIWLYRAMVNARGLGLPARLSPVWGVIGFIIPIISFWFPYWCAVDLFPKGHEGRGAVLRWWLLYLGAQLVSTGSVIAVFVSFEAAIVLAVLSAGLFVIAGLLARSMVRAASALHTTMAHQAGLVAVPGGLVPGAPGMPAPAAVDPWARAAERQDDPWST